MVEPSDDDPIGLEATQLGEARADVSERELARDFVRAQLQLGDLPTRAIGRYQLVRTLGSGGMGVVMEAHDPQLDREVAIKVLHRGSDGSSQAAARLMREARSIARLSHPNVVQVYDTGVNAGRLYVVMELVAGTSLRRWMDEPHETLEVLDMVLAAGRGLEAAHQAGVIHRDFKPANVLVSSDGRPRVVDFGLARPLSDGEVVEDDEPVSIEAEMTSLLITSTGAVMGTPAYMAPEQFVGAEADPRTDQLAFCIVLFEALLGRRPFAGDSFAQLCHAVLHEGVRFPPEAQRLPQGLRLALARGLRRRRAERFPDMGALLDAIEEAIAPLRRADAPSEDAAPRLATTRGRLAHLHDYLEALPQGSSSHPQIEMRASPVRLALARHPIDDLAVLPADVADTVRARLPAQEWIPEVHARTVLAAIRDLAHPPGPEGDADFGRMITSSIRATLSAGFYGFTMPTAGSSRLLRAVLRSWSELHRGTWIETETAGDGFAVLYMEHPAGLLGPLGRLEVTSALQTALAFAGVRYTDARVLEAEAEVLRFELRWA